MNTDQQPSTGPAEQQPTTALPAEGRSFYQLSTSEKVHLNRLAMETFRNLIDTVASGEGFLDVTDFQGLDEDFMEGESVVYTAGRWVYMTPDVDYHIELTGSIGSDRSYSCNRTLTFYRYGKCFRGLVNSAFSPKLCYSGQITAADGKCKYAENESFLFLLLDSIVND